MTVVWSNVNTYFDRRALDVPLMCELASMKFDEDSKLGDSGCQREDHEHHVVKTYKVKTSILRLGDISEAFRRR